MWHRNGHRLSPEQAVRALLVSGTSAQDEQIMAAVRVTARPRVRRIAEQQRMTGISLGGGWK
ncbi:MAG: hypothetical protein GY926_16440 [bacterium]|nr:hypothetical protein [bacterium]